MATPGSTSQLLIIVATIVECTTSIRVLPEVLSLAVFIFLAMAPTLCPAIFKLRVPLKLIWLPHLACLLFESFNQEAFCGRDF
jgi:hypothetical protein